MKSSNIIIHYQELEDEKELPGNLQELLHQAKAAIDDAYAPYSKFRVGAAVLLENGEIVKGSNQENASSPVGICAERVTLSAVSALHPNIPIVALAISAKAQDHVLTEAVAPCGVCRQTIAEYEDRFKRKIEVVLQGETGKIIWLQSAKLLLPFSFGRNNLRPS